MSLETEAPIAADTSLTGQTATGPGTAFAVAPGLQDYGMQVVATGSPTVNLEGSIDVGDTTVATPHWFKLAQWVGGTNASGDIVWSTDKPVVAVRANYVSGSGTVYAYITGNKFQ